MRRDENSLDVGSGHFRECFLELLDRSHESRVQCYPKLFGGSFSSSHSGQMRGRRRNQEYAKTLRLRHQFFECLKGLSREFRLKN